MTTLSNAVTLNQSVSLDPSAVTASSTLDMTYSRFAINATSADIALTLPVGARDGQLIWLYRIDAVTDNTITITPSSCTVRDAAGNSVATLTLPTHGASLQLMYNTSAPSGTTWFQVGGSSYGGTLT